MWMIPPHYKTAVDRAVEDHVAEETEKLKRKLEHMRRTILLVTRTGFFRTFDYPEPDLGLGLVLYSLIAEGFIPDPGRNEPPEFPVITAEQVDRFTENLTHFLDSGLWTVTIQKADATISEWTKLSRVSGLPLGRLGQKIDLGMQIHLKRNP